MRRLIPAIVLAAAILIHMGRNYIIKPILPEGERARRELPATVQSAGLDGAIIFESEGREAAEPAVSPVPFMPPAAIHPGEIERNSSLYLELRKIDVTPVDIDRLVKATRKTFNLKRVRAGQKFVAYTHPTSGRLDSLTFHIDRERRLNVWRESENKFASAIHRIPHKTTYHVVQGTIRQSLFVSLQKQDADTDLAAHLAEIFGWTVDFFSDIRRGDSYAILYEQKTYSDGYSTLGSVLSAKLISQGKEHHAFRYAGEGDRAGYYDIEGKSLQKSLLRVPMKYTRITSNFSHRRYHPLKKRYEPHYGVDYGAPTGTPVFTTGDGVVVTASRRSGNGNYVKIKHNGTFTTYYLHLSRFAKGIKAGRKVRQGQVIGYVGSTGAASAPHLDYRIKKNGSWVNPRRMELPSKAPVPKASFAQFERARNSFLWRIKEAKLAGNGDGTMSVDQPVNPTDEQASTLF